MPWETLQREWKEFQEREEIPPEDFWASCRLGTHDSRLIELIQSLTNAEAGFAAIVEDTSYRNSPLKDRPELSVEHENTVNLLSLLEESSSIQQLSKIVPNKRLSLLFTYLKNFNDYINILNEKERMIAPEMQKLLISRIKDTVRYFGNFLLSFIKSTPHQPSSNQLSREQYHAWLTSWVFFMIQIDLRLADFESNCPLDRESSEAVENPVYEGKWIEVLVALIETVYSSGWRRQESDPEISNNWPIVGLMSLLSLYPLSLPIKNELKSRLGGKDWTVLPKEQQTLYEILFAYLAEVPSEALSDSLLQAIWQVIQQNQAEVKRTSSKLLLQPGIIIQAAKQFIKPDNSEEMQLFGKDLLQEIIAIQERGKSRKEQIKARTRSLRYCYESHPSEDENHRREKEALLEAFLLDPERIDWNQDHESSFKLSVIVTQAAMEEDTAPSRPAFLHAWQVMLTSAQCLDWSAVTGNIIDGSDVPLLALMGRVLSFSEKESAEGSQFFLKLLSDLRNSSEEEKKALISLLEKHFREPCPEMSLVFVWAFTSEKNLELFIEIVRAVKKTGKIFSSQPTFLKEWVSMCIAQIDIIMNFFKKHAQPWEAIRIIITPFCEARMLSGPELLVKRILEGLGAVSEEEVRICELIIQVMQKEFQSVYLVAIQALLKDPRNIALFKKLIVLPHAKFLREDIYRCFRQEYPTGYPTELSQGWGPVEKGLMQGDRSENIPSQQPPETAGNTEKRVYTLEDQFISLHSLMDSYLRDLKTSEKFNLKAIESLQKKVANKKELLLKRSPVNLLEDFFDYVEQLSALLQLEKEQLSYAKGFFNPTSQDWMKLSGEMLDVLAYFMKALLLSSLSHSLGSHSSRQAYTQPLIEVTLLLVQLHLQYHSLVGPNIVRSLKSELWIEVLETLLNTVYSAEWIPSLENCSDSHLKWNWPVIALMYVLTHYCPSKEEISLGTLERIHAYLSSKEIDKQPKVTKWFYEILNSHLGKQVIYSDNSLAFFWLPFKEAKDSRRLGLAPYRVTMILYMVSQPRVFSTGKLGGDFTAEKLLTELPAHISLGPTEHNSKIGFFECFELLKQEVSRTQGEKYMDQLLSESGEVDWSQTPSPFTFVSDEDGRSLTERIMLDWKSFEPYLARIGERMSSTSQKLPWERRGIAGRTAYVRLNFNLPGNEQKTFLEKFDLASLPEKMNSPSQKLPGEKIGKGENTGLLRFIGYLPAAHQVTFLKKFHEDLALALKLGEKELVSLVKEGFEKTSDPTLLKLFLSVVGNFELFVKIVQLVYPAKEKFPLSHALLPHYLKLFEKHWEDRVSFLVAHPDAIAFLVGPFFELKGEKGKEAGGVWLLRKVLEGFQGVSQEHYRTLSEIIERQFSASCETAIYSLLKNTQYVSLLLDALQQPSGAFSRTIHKKFNHVYPAVPPQAWIPVYELLRGQGSKGEAPLVEEGEKAKKEVAALKSKLSQGAKQSLSYPDFIQYQKSFDAIQLLWHPLGTVQQNTRNLHRLKKAIHDFPDMLTNYQSRLMERERLTSEQAQWQSRLERGIQEVENCLAQVEGTKRAGELLKALNSLSRPDGAKIERALEHAVEGLESCVRVFKDHEEILTQQIREAQQAIAEREKPSSRRGGKAALHPEGVRPAAVGGRNRPGQIEAGAVPVGPARKETLPAGVGSFFAAARVQARKIDNPEYHQLRGALIEAFTEERFAQYRGGTEQEDVDTRIFFLTLLERFIEVGELLGEARFDRLMSHHVELYCYDRSAILDPDNIFVQLMSAVRQFEDFGQFSYAAGQIIEAFFERNPLPTLSSRKKDKGSYQTLFVILVEDLIAISQGAQRFMHQLEEEVGAIGLSYFLAERMLVRLLIENLFQTLMECGKIPNDQLDNKGPIEEKKTLVFGKLREKGVVQSLSLSSDQVRAYDQLRCYRNELRHSEEAKPLKTKEARKKLDDAIKAFLLAFAKEVEPKLESSFSL